MSEWLYIAACVLGPGIWGVLMYLLFNAIDRRRKKRPPREGPPVDYSI